MLQDALIYLLGKDLLAFTGLMLYTFFLFGIVNAASSYSQYSE